LSRTAPTPSTATPFGTTTLLAYLPTRTFELTVHTLDIAQAIDIDVPERLDDPIEASLVLAARLVPAGDQGGVRRSARAARGVHRAVLILAAQSARQWTIPQTRCPWLWPALEWEPANSDDRIAQAHALVELATDPSTDGIASVIVCGDLSGHRVASALGRVGQPLHGRDEAAPHLRLIEKGGLDRRAHHG
jgi:hypothetical protein